MPNVPAHAPAALALALSVLAGGATAAPATLYELAPVTPSHQSTLAQGLNNLGQAVGMSWGQIDTAGVSFDQRLAAFWHTPTAGPVTRVVLPAPLLQAGTAVAINDAGRIAGTVGGNAFRWSPDGPGPAYTYGGAALPLGNLGIGDHRATGISANGMVIGNYWKCAPSAPDCSLGNDRAWRWNPVSGMQPVGPETGYWTYAQAINAAGDMLVANTTAANGRVVEIHAADGSVTPVPMGDDVFAQGGSMDLNDGRQIAATRLVTPPSGPGWREAFVWSGGVEFDLLHLNPEKGGSALAINNLGWVVGSEHLGVNNFAAALWVGTGLVFDLNTLLPAEDAALWTLEEAVDISDTGWIAGNGWFRATPDADPQRRGWLMQLSADFIGTLPPGPLFPPPGGTVPLPGTLALMALALLAAGAARRHA